MDNNYKYDYVCFAYFRDKLNLKKYEDILRKGGIIPYQKEKVNERISPYFSFLNTGNTNSFSKDEKKKFDELFSNDLDTLLNNGEVINFIEQTYKKYYFSDIKSKYTFFIPGNYEFLAPSDAITLGINYQQFENSEEYDEEKMFEKEGIIVDVINEIQEKISEETNIKVAVLKYSELAINQPAAIL